jgi:hypothetical protein
MLHSRFGVPDSGLDSCVTYADIRRHRDYVCMRRAWFNYGCAVCLPIGGID